MAGKTVFGKAADGSMVKIMECHEEDISKPKYEKHSMREKYAFHANRAFENHKPAGSKMTKKELAAYSAGYVKHAEQSLAAAKYNAALNVGYDKKTASRFARSKNTMIDFNTGKIVQKNSRN